MALHTSLLQVQGEVADAWMQAQRAAIAEHTTGTTSQAFDGSADAGIV
jgi:hypothetical protein